MTDIQSEQLGNQNAEVATAMDALFPESEDQGSRRRLTGMAAGVLAAGTAYLGYRNGVDMQTVSDVFDAKLVPTPPVREEIVDGFVAVNNGLRTIAPPVLLGGLGFRAFQKWRSGGNDQQAALEEFARTDYSGTDSLTDSQDSERKAFGRFRQKMGKVTAGVGVAALTALFAGGSSGVENEVSNGPLRPVEATFDAFAPDGSRSIVLDSTDGTFMSDSMLDTETVDMIAASAQAEDVTVIPFGKRLPDADGNSSLIISIPDSLFAAQTGTTPEVMTDCAEIPILMDGSRGTQIGDIVDINGGQDARVVGIIDNIEQMNRNIEITPQTAMNACIEKSDDPEYFGAIVSGENKDAVVEKLFEQTGVSGDYAHVTEEKFEESNREFWQKNGTPILLELIAYGGAIGAFAIGSERRAALQRHLREIGTLHAIGRKMNQIRNIEIRRAMKDSAKATLIAAPLMPAMASLFNAAEQGLRVGVGLREVAVGYTVALTAKLTGSIRAVRKFGKDLNKAEAVKG